MGSRQADRYMNEKCQGLYMERKTDTIQLLVHANALAWWALSSAVVMDISKVSMVLYLTTSSRLAWCLRPETWFPSLLRSILVRREFSISAESHVPPHLKYLFPHIVLTSRRRSLLGPSRSGPQFRNRYRGNKSYI